LITSILRFETFFQNNSFTDGTFSAAILLILTQVETGVYLISACAVTYKPLLGRMGEATISKKLKSRVVAGGNQNSWELYGGSRDNSDGDRRSRIPLKIRQTSITGHAWGVEDGWNRLPESKSTQGPGIIVETNITVASQEVDGLEEEDGSKLGLASSRRS
jgi:hypothetical protein